MTSQLPIHPTLVHPHTGLPLEAIFVSEKTGRVYWPVIGAEDGSGDGSTADGSGESGDQGGGRAADGTTDTGFPANTPLEQMKPEQREAYWRHHARKHEQRVKDLGNLTPDELKTLRDKADRHDALEQELQSDTEKQIAAAEKAAREEAIAEARPEVIAATLDAAAARAGISEESLKAATQFVDDRKFLGENGKIDTDKVKVFIEAIKPVRGNQQDRRGPSATGPGNGSGPGSSATGSARDKGHAEAVRRGFVKTA